MGSRCPCWVTCLCTALCHLFRGPHCTLVLPAVSLGALSDQGLGSGLFLVSLGPSSLPGIFLFVQKNNTIIALFLMILNLNKYFLLKK